MSARVGKNILLVQGAGGNSSVKDGDVLWVKASGTWLADAEDQDIFVPVSLSAARTALALGDEHSKVVEMRKRGVLSPLECERIVLGFTHPELSAEAMDFWKLPEVIQRAVRDHHQPAADPDGKSGEIPLSYVVDAANQFVNSQGLSIIENLPGEFADGTIVEGLGLDPNTLAALLREYQSEAGAMAQFFK